MQLIIMLLANIPSLFVFAKDPKMTFDTFFNTNPAPFYDVESYHVPILTTKIGVSLSFLNQMLEMSSQDNAQCL